MDKQNFSSNSEMDFENEPRLSIDNISFYRQITQNFNDMLDFTNAAYWADKVVDLSHGAQQDVYNLSKCFFNNGEYLRAAHTLRFWKYENVNIYFRCLHAKCWYMVKDYTKALTSLDSDFSRTTFHRPKVQSQWEPFDPRKTIKSEYYLLKGKIYSEQLNRSLAMENFRKCLQHDIYCHEAFQRLTEYESKTSSEVLELVKELSFSELCANKDADILQYLYIDQEKSKLPDMDHKNSMLSPFEDNTDVLTAKAETYLRGGHVRKAYKLAKKVIQKDSFHPTCLSVMIACLVQLKMDSDLFKLSHSLVDLNPNSSVSWYSVGAYYFILGNQELARVNLNKALTLNPVFGPAWLLFGHSFAVEDEHDQAMAAYFKGSKLMRGSHLPLLLGAVECSLTNNTSIALSFLKDATAIAPNDPLLLHETGVILFREKKYSDAYNQLKECEHIIINSEDDICINEWEALYNNMGHCCRKLQMYSESLKYHRKALSLNPTKYSTYASIGLLYTIDGEYDKACEAFHIVLSRSRDDSFSNAMLSIVIDKISAAYEDSEDDEECDSLLNISSIPVETDGEKCCSPANENVEMSIN